MGLWGAATGCAARNASEGPPTTAEAPDSFRLVYGFSAEAEVGETRVYGAEDAETPAQVLPAWSLAWEGRLTLEPARVFRDESLGYRVELGEVTRTLDGTAEPVTSPISGRVIELRAFSSGELLDSALMDHLVGRDRYGDLLLPLWGGLRASPPRLLPQQSATRNDYVPFMVGDERFIRVRRVVTWTYLGVEREPGAGALHHFRYQGPLRGEGRDRTDAWQSTPELEGECDGEIWIRARDLAVERHRFRWDLEWEVRFTETEAVAGQAGGGEPVEVPVLEGRILQDQRIEGRLSVVHGSDEVPPSPARSPAEDGKGAS